MSRLSIPFLAPNQRLPDLSQDEFYDLDGRTFVRLCRFTIGGADGGADFVIRFAGFECAPYSGAF
ncbi:hypothetical protein BYT27DRAFT_7259713 [Phlegmacium glaucopus]|nr:hypothetical protein BYT27DRAFT_7259713 [Phlegmacium glaucopus]